MLAGFSTQKKRALFIDRAHTCNSDAAKLDKENPTPSAFLIADVSMACRQRSNGYIVNLCTEVKKPQLALQRQTAIHESKVKALIMV